VPHVDVGKVLGGGKYVGQLSVGIVDRPAVGCHDPSGVGARRLHRHLLAQHDTDSELVFVHGARDALPRGLRD